MKSFPIVIVITLFAVITASCSSSKSSEDESEADLVSITSASEQYFEGNLSITNNAAFLEESFTGAIIPVDITGLSFMIETELPQISKTKGEPVFIRLKGFLNPKTSEGENAEKELVIKSITNSDTGRKEITPMTGTYKGDGQTLTISPDRTFKHEYRNGSIESGSWLLRSNSILLLITTKGKTIMKINYKKKSLNGRDDNPVIFLLTSPSH